MCGISGMVLREGPVDLKVVDRQLRVLNHRGPDASGYYQGGRAVVAQNRLAIIDLVDGDPPIHNEDETVGVVLNGELYNFPELRHELLSRGHRFATHGDTEVLVHLAEECRPSELARRLRGMFAFAIWDERRERLVLGRDRLGKKPLFYWASDEAFVFASEIKALLVHPAVVARLEPRAISAYLTFGYVPGGLTFFEGIRSVPPGHTLTVAPGGSPELEAYWQPQIPGVGGVEALDLSMAEAAAEVRRLLEQAVSRRLISDVPLGAFLSGGIDSSAIVGVMAGLVDTAVPTFTIGFEDNEGFDERPYAREVARRHGTDHHEEVVAPDAVDLVERLVWHHDQPFGDSSAIPTFLLCEMTRRHVTVAVSGDGGDELFAGYERFAATLAVERYRAVPRALRAVAVGTAGRLPPTMLRGRVGNAQRFAAVAAMGLPDAPRAWVSFIDEQTRQALLPTRDDWAFEDYRRRWRETEGAHTLDRILELNLTTYLPDDLMVKADRMSMAHALEVRSPFLDADLVDFALLLPPSLKVRGLNLKRVLKEAVADVVPERILGRRKRGFGVPLDRWFREDLRAYVDATLGSPDAAVRRHLRPEGVDRVLYEHASGVRNHGHALWTLLTLEVFLRKQGW